MTGWDAARTNELRAVINRVACVHDADHELYCAICDLLGNAPLDDETRKYLRHLRDWTKDDAERTHRDKRQLMELLDKVSP